MKRKILYIIGVILLVQMFSFRAMAEEHKAKDGVDIIVEQVERIGDKVYIKLYLDMSEIQLKSQESIEYIPFLISSTQGVELPKVLLQGRNSYKSYQREIVLMGKKERLEYNLSKPYAIVKEFGNDDKVLSYEYILAYETWMSDAKLELKTDLSAYRESLAMSSTILVNNIIPEKTLVPILDNVVPILKTISKSTDLLKIYFPVSISEITLDYMDNAEKLDLIKTVVNEISSSKNRRIKEVIITGFTSIEGPYRYNKSLSLRRAQSICTYLLGHTKIDSSVINVQNGIENWDELSKIVATSDMKDKAEVLGIMDSVIVEDREKELKNLNKGEPYKYMEEHFFSELRYATYVNIYYEDVIDIIAEKINKAIEDIRAKRYDEALCILQDVSVSNDIRSQTPIGVCYMMMGDFEEAKLYLQKAYDRCDENALKNLEQIIER